MYHCNLGLPGFVCVGNRLEVRNLLVGHCEGDHEVLGLFLMPVELGG